MKSHKMGASSAPKKSAAPISSVAAGHNGGVIANKVGPVSGALKGMGHTQAPVTGIATDRGAFKIKG